jgi:hypothetical protein
MHVRTSRRLTWLFIGLATAGCLIGIMVPAGLGWDFANFYDAGRRAAAGQIDDIYDSTSLIAGEPPQGQMRFWGPPISAFFYAPMSAFAPDEALVLFKTQNVLAYTAALLLLFGSCRRFVSDSASARWEFASLFAGLCLLYQPFWTVFRVGGQTTATVLLLIVVGLVFHTAGRLWGSAVCVAAAALIKPAFAPALACLVALSGPAYFRNITVILGAVGLLSVALLGWPVHQAFLDRVLGESQTAFPWYHNSSLYIVIDALRGHLAARLGDGPFSVLGWLLKATTLGTAVYLALQARRQPWQPAARRHFHFMLAIIFFLLWSTTLWEHYLALLFPFLAYLVASRDHMRPSALALVGAIFILSLAQNLILMHWLRDRFAFDALGPLMAVVLVKSGPLWLTLVLLWRHSPELFRSYAAPDWAADSTL